MKVPARLGKDVRILERHGAKRQGIIISSDGKNLWIVKFDNEDQTVPKISRQLKIDKTAYGVTSSVFTPSARRDIAKTVNSLVKKTTAKTRKETQNQNISHDNCPAHNSNVLTTRKKDSPVLSRNDNSTIEENSSLRSRNSPDNFQFDSGLLQTSSSSDKSNSSIAENIDFNFNDNIATSTEMENNIGYIPLEGEPLAEETDILDEEEDDNGQCPTTGGVLFNDEDEESQPVFCDYPEKAQEYKTKSENMRKEKEDLIKNEKKVLIECKAKKTYSFGAKVRGRQQIGNRFFDHGIGTVIEVLGNDQFCVEFESETVVANKKELALETRNSEFLEWKVVRDHISGTPTTEYDGFSGVIGKDVFQQEWEPSSENYMKSFANLFIKLWPGDWHEQIETLNAFLEEKKIKLVDDNEWWNFFGILIFAGGIGMNGKSLFTKYKKERYCVEEHSVDLSHIMRKHRFLEIYANIIRAFSGGDQKYAWNPMLSLIDGFNINRSKKVAASVKKIIDESMSAFKPRTTRTGFSKNYEKSFPFLSFILRKPKPMGIEFKATACSVTGILIYLEIQEGKNPMRKKKYSEALGGTAGCTLRLVKGSEYCGSNKNEARKQGKIENKRELWNGDSWFTSITLIQAMKREGHEYFGALKNNHRGCPKNFVEETMKNWPSGSYIVLENEKEKLFYLGYRYSAKKKICHFLGSWEAGSTYLGNPYVAKWPDSYGNVQKRNVARPDVVSKYFEKSNVIDRHNHLRQHELALEEVWLTKDPWFRMFTTFVGMTVTDAFLAAKHQTPKKANIHRMTMKKFAKILAHDLWNIDFSKKAKIVEEIGEGTNQRGKRKRTSYDVLNSHRILKTQKRNPDGSLVRRACKYKEEGCERTRIATECQNPICLREVSSSCNRHKNVLGVFICRNKKCLDKHHIDVMKLHNEVHQIHS